MTPEQKAHIDSLSVHDLLEGVRYAPVGSPWFQGETGAYWMARLKELRSQDQGAYVSASKALS